jgi:hypothetical protein
MRQSSEPPVARRLRVVRRRITAAVLATFVAAWLAVAALGKSGSPSTAASPAPTTGTSSQSDGSASPAPSQSDGSSSPAQSQSDGSSSSGADSGSSLNSQQGGPVTTSQS